MKNKTVILSLSLSLVQVSFFLSAYPEKAFSHRELYLLVMFLVGASMLFVCIELYLTAQQIQKNTCLNLELSLLKHQQYLSNKQTEALKERQLETAQYQQYMTCCLEQFQKYLEHGEYEAGAAYLDKITRSFQTERFRPCCKDSLLNALLESKRHTAAKYGIQVHYEILLSEFLDISSADISCILFNLLDNGIEACRRSHTPVPFLRLSIELRAGFLTIHMQNTKNPEESLNGNTAKKDRQNHGFGLSIIEEMCALHDGSCYWQDNGKTFHSVVILRQ